MHASLLCCGISRTRDGVSVNRTSIHGPVECEVSAVKESFEKYGIVWKPPGREHDSSTVSPNIS